MADPTDADKTKAHALMEETIGQWPATIESILAQALADEREAMREAAAKECELIGEGYGHEFAERIRRLP